MEEETHTAIALRYDPSGGEAVPQVVAKGEGSLAAQILRVAREHEIPLRRDPALAGALATLDVGDRIPPELFRAVAEVLAFVYKMNGKG